MSNDMNWDYVEKYIIDSYFITNSDKGASTGKIVAYVGNTFFLVVYYAWAFSGDFATMYSVVSLKKMQSWMLFENEEDYVAAIAYIKKYGIERYARKIFKTPNKRKQDETLDS